MPLQSQETTDSVRAAIYLDTLALRRAERAEFYMEAYERNKDRMEAFEPPDDGLLGLAALLWSKPDIMPRWVVC